MNKMNKILSSVAAAAVLTSTVAVASTVSDKGNYLVTPAYFAQAGYSSKIEIFNTNNTKAVVAKVVVREASCSQELKDFLVFLSPGDAYSAEIKVVDGKVKIFSSDDSNDTGTYIHEAGGDVELGSDGTAAALLKNGLELLEGAVYAPAALTSSGAPTTVKAAGTKLTALDIYNKGNSKAVTKFSAGAGYVEVFTLLELDAKELAKAFKENWKIKTPLKKEYMVEFYDAITKKLNGNANIDFGTRDNNFTDYKNVNDATYAPILKAIDDDATFKSSKGEDWDIDAILNVDNVAPTGIPADYIEKIDSNLLTGTVTIKNVKEGTEAAMTTPMYSYNIANSAGAPLLTNRVFGERQAETNYVRVLNGDPAAANVALGGLIQATNSSAIYIPYTKGKPSLLNTLFLAKNLSNHKCLTRTSSAGAVVGVERQGINYISDIRNMQEKVFKITSKANPFSGYYQDSAEASSIWPELGQLHVKKVIDKTPNDEYTNGWITVNFNDGFAYDVDEKVINSGITPYAVTRPSGYRPAVLPSYMQVIGTSNDKTYTNMYRPAVQ